MSVRRRSRKLPLYVNFPLTGLELYVFYWAVLWFSYDGYCYGFTDGKTPCAFADHVRDSDGCLIGLWPFYLPIALFLGIVVLVVNQSLLYGGDDDRCEEKPTKRPSP